MTSGADNTAETRTSDNTVYRETFTSLGLAMVGVTWRMYVPMLGLFFAGLWLDGLFDSKPWLMSSGFAVGTAAAVILVRQQLKKVDKK